MGTTNDPIEHVSFLSRSTARIEILRELLESGPTTRREFRDRLDTSRSTITRAISAHEDRGWIERDGDACRLTTNGHIIAETFLDMLESVRMADEYSTFLRWFPYEDYDLDVGELDRAAVTTSTSGDPYAPARKQTEILDGTSRFRGVFPSIDIEGTKVVHGRIMEEDFEVEIVVSSGVEDTITSGEYAPLFRQQLKTGQLSVFVFDGELPFYLGLGDDDRAQIGVEDDEGFPRALLDSTTEATREFGENVYQDFRDRSRRKTVPEF